MKTRRTEVKSKNMKMMQKDQMIALMKKINEGKEDNVQSRKNALKTLMSGIPVGDKVFVLGPVEDLHVDESYQRPIQDHVNIIAREWDDMKCDPLKINYREDGNLYVWDGMHRLTALKMRNIDFVLCVITVGMSQQEEAKCFGSQGNGIKKPNSYNIYKANICSGEEIDTKIKEICDYYNIEVGRNKKAGYLSCLSLVRNIYRIHEEEYFEWTLDVLDLAYWNDHPQAHCHKVISALYEIRKLYDEEQSEYIKRKLVEHLKTIDPEELLVKASYSNYRYKADSKRIKLYLLDVINDNSIVK